MAGGFSRPVPYVDEFEGSWYLVTRRHQELQSAVQAQQSLCLLAHRRGGRSTCARWLAHQQGYRVWEEDLRVAVESGRLFDTSPNTVVVLRVDDELENAALPRVATAWQHGMRMKRSEVVVLFHVSSLVWRMMSQMTSVLQEHTPYAVIPHFARPDHVGVCLEHFDLDGSLAEPLHEAILGHPEWHHLCIDWLRNGRPGPEGRGGVRPWLLDPRGPLGPVWAQLAGTPPDSDLAALLLAVAEGDGEAIAKMPASGRDRLLTRGWYDLDANYPVPRVRPIVLEWFRRRRGLTNATQTAP